ncbi:hypothetical protein F3087_45690 [Nocardia colli]|uniref:Uncharacterized protein n=1 Tax=Nocardia colli TaxID=2545717 RepID=A0A5N0DJC4_9NOCA|nr:hypothetical protein [Nocardia colli]KAA8877178.1 hypothetical protein F3087_45690 [Nocardia colli]
MDYWIFESRAVGHADANGGFVFDRDPEDALIGDPPLFLVRADLADELTDYGYRSAPITQSIARDSAIPQPPTYLRLDTAGRSPGIDDAALTADGKLVVSNAFLALVLPFGIDTSADFLAWKGSEGEHR